MPCKQASRRKAHLTLPTNLCIGRRGRQLDTAVICTRGERIVFSGPNTNTNTIRFQEYCQIQIIFVFKIKAEYEHYSKVCLHTVLLGATMESNFIVQEYFAGLVKWSWYSKIKLHYISWLKRTTEKYFFLGQLKMDITVNLEGLCLQNYPPQSLLLVWSKGFAKSVQFLAWSLKTFRCCY